METRKIYSKVAKGEPYRKAGARLTEDAEEIQYRTKLGDPAQQMREFKIYHKFAKAHLVMLAEQKIIDRADSAKMLKALREMEERGLDAIRAETQAGEHSGEAWLISELGEETGGKIHAGRWRIPHLKRRLMEYSRPDACPSRMARPSRCVANIRRMSRTILCRAVDC